MTTFNKLQMAHTICSDLRVSKRKSFFGLSATLTYNATHSIIDARQIELTQPEGDHLSRLMNAGSDTMLKAASSTKLKPIVNGNYRLDACISRDHQFVALQLLKYMQLNYEPVTDIMIFEHDEAQRISAML